MTKTDQSPYSVEGLLPQDFIYSLGVYLQTCAHIEQTSCVLLSSLDTADINTQAWLDRFNICRKMGAKDLLKELKKANVSAEKHGFGNELEELRLWIEQYTENRHIAVHGAFVCSPSGFLRVDYVKKRKSGDCITYENIRVPVTKELVDQLISDADRIYKILLGMICQIDPSLPSKFPHRIFPVVEHPSGH